MKVLSVFLTNGQCLSVKDQDNSNIVDYSKKLSDLLQSNNVTLLHTSESSLVVRPSKIQALVISEEKQDNETEAAELPEIEEVKDTEDIISD